MIKNLLGLSLLLGLVLAACSKSTIVGSEILSDDFVDVAFTDTTTIKLLNIKADSTRVYPPNSSTYLLGDIDDPVFGKTSTEVYSQIRKLFDIPDMENAVLDSVVLSVSISSSGFWGDSLAIQDIEVFELGESISDYDSIYSNQQFQKGMLLGSKSFNPVRTDTAAVVVNGDTLYYNNIFRMQLDPSFGEKLLADTMALQNDTLIQELTNGLIIKASSVSNAVFGINNAVYLDDYTNKVILYYTSNDTITRKHALTLGGKRGMYIDNDRSNALIDNYLQNQEGSDTLLFLSGLQNSNLMMEIPSLDGFDDVMINYAEIEFYVATLDNSLRYTGVEQIHMLNEDEEGNLSYIEDLNISIIQNVINYYDGLLVEEENEEGFMIKKYNINFTNELKRRINEGDTSTRLLLVPAISSSRAYRSLLFGPESSSYPARLKITYTNN